MLHRLLGDINNHVIQSYTVADSIALLALVVTIDDVGRVAYKEDDKTFHLLFDETGPDWLEIGSGGGTTGTVTSIDITSTTGLTFSGGPITTSGSFTMAGTLGAINGGTGLSSYTLGDILYSSATNVLSKLGIGSTNQVLSVSAGIPAWVSFNINNTIGVLGETKGGTDQNGYVLGDILYASATNTLSRLTAGSPGDVLTISVTGIPSWATGGGGGSGSVTSIDISGGTTGLTFGGGPITTNGTFTAAGVLAAIHGGTGLNAIGSNGSVLVVVSGAPAWVAPASLVILTAKASANQTVTTAVMTKVVLPTEDFDTNSNFDNVTNNRFTPTVAGYYFVTGKVRGSSASAFTSLVAAIYKNGAEYCREQITGTFTAGPESITVSCIVSMNGSTDYLELWGSVTGTTPVFNFTSATASSRLSASPITASAGGGGGSGLLNILETLGSVGGIATERLKVQNGGTKTNLELGSNQAGSILLGLGGNSRGLEGVVYQPGFNHNGQSGANQAGHYNLTAIIFAGGSDFLTSDNSGLGANNTFPELTSIEGAYCYTGKVLVRDLTSGSIEFAAWEIKGYVDSYNSYCTGTATFIDASTDGLTWTCNVNPLGSQLGIYITASPTYNCVANCIVETLELGRI